MPIVDVRPVVSASRKLPPDAAQLMADSIARTLNAKAGQVWVRLSEIEDGKYAENGASVEDDDLPVFVQVLHSDWPQDETRITEAEALAKVVAISLGRQIDRVHIEYAPAGRGRVAFGGILVR